MTLDMAVNDYAMLLEIEAGYARHSYQTSYIPAIFARPTAEELEQARRRVIEACLAETE